MMQQHTYCNRNLRNFFRSVFTSQLFKKTLSVSVLSFLLFTMIPVPSYAQGNAAPGVSLKNVMKKSIKKAEKKALLSESQIHAGHNSPHMPYILKEVEKRKLPREIAYLPVIESGFQQHAVSNKGARGLWQLMPGTASQYGLKDPASISDVKSSTGAALTYIEYLNKKFNRDWDMTLAAYNAGEGRIARAIKNNKAAGKSTSVSALKLPKETRDYIGKFQVLKRVLKSNKLATKK